MAEQRLCSGERCRGISLLGGTTRRLWSARRCGGVALRSKAMAKDGEAAEWQSKAEAEQGEAAARQSIAVARQVGAPICGGEAGQG